MLQSVVSCSAAPPTTAAASVDNNATTPLHRPMMMNSKEKIVLEEELNTTCDTVLSATSSYDDDQEEEEEEDSFEEDIVTPLPNLNTRVVVQHLRRPPSSSSSNNNNNNAKTTAQQKVQLQRSQQQKQKQKQQFQIVTTGSDLRVAKQTHDIPFILHKMRQRRDDVHFQIWAVDALNKCNGATDIDPKDDKYSKISQEITTNVLRAIQRHPYSDELQHKAILCLTHLGKESDQIKECIVATPDWIGVLFKALKTTTSTTTQQLQSQSQQLAKTNDDDTNEIVVDGREEMGDVMVPVGEQQQQDQNNDNDNDDDERKKLKFELHVAVFSLLAVGFDQFDHSMLVDEGAIDAIVEVLQQKLLLVNSNNHHQDDEEYDEYYYTDDDNYDDDDNSSSSYNVVTIFEWGMLALSELSWLCEDMTVPQVFPNLQQIIKLVVQTMERYPYNSSIQNSCGEILRHIMKNDPDSIRAVKEAGGAKALIAALYNHLDQEDVLVEGCLTLSHFLPFPDIRDECFTTVLATMAQQSTNVDVQLGGCTFLADAAQQYTSNTFRFLFDSSPAVPLLMTAMELHPTNERLQQHGCRAFQTLGPWVKNRSERKKLKIMGLVIGAMKKYSNNNKNKMPEYYWLQLYGCQAVLAMVSSWEKTEVTSFLVKVGGIKCLLCTMEQYHMEDAEILWPTLAIVSQLDLLGNKFARDAIMKEKCLRIMMDGMKRHLGHNKVQQFGNNVLDLLAKVNTELSNKTIIDLDCRRSGGGGGGDCCLRCLKLSLTRESSERWQGCSCSSSH